MANLQKRGETSWRVEINLGKDPLTGKRKRYRETFEARNKTEAKKIALGIEAKVKNGIYVDTSKTTVGEYSLKWIDFHEINIDVTTKERYSTIIRRHLIPGLGQIQLTDLEPAHIQLFYNKEATDGRVDGKGDMYGMG